MLDVGSVSPTLTPPSQLLFLFSYIVPVMPIDLPRLPTVKGCVLQPP